MSLPEIRPRFKRKASLSQPLICERLESAAQQDDQVDCRISHGWIYLSIPKDDQHIWSPRLSIELESEEEGPQLLTATFGPNPNVWLLFVFIYSFIGFAAMIIVIIGGSRMSLGLSASILWLIPVLALIVGMVYYSAYTGQKLAKDQMWLLYEFFHKSLDSQLDIVED